jgi:3-isopropylmalate/(R)-2-methylmalate dehydratase large subunit
MKRSIIDKIWDAHVVHQTEGHPAVFAIDLHLIHEVTSPQGFTLLSKQDIPFAQPERTFGTLDHAIPTRNNRHIIYDIKSKKQVNMFRDNVMHHAIPHVDFRSGYQGIVHMIGPELGLTQPGMTIVCGDSHTSTHGAFGAMGFGIGSSEVALVMATGCILQHKPKTYQVKFTGTPQPGVFSKDYILALIAEIGVGGGNGHIFEYSGNAIESLNMEERMTICNMSIEAGARAGIISPDQTTLDYLKGRPYAPRDEDWNAACEQYLSYASDAGCSYDKKITLDVSSLTPRITWGINPSHGIGIDDVIPSPDDFPETERATIEKALSYTGLTAGDPIAGTKIDWAFLGSCTNSRMEDLRIAANILKGKTIHPDVTMYVVPGSEQVKRQAEAEGLDQIFIDAGADWRQPGCSMCLAMNDDKVPAGARCISSSNRNFMGRQGPGSITHLASPATVVASAVKGGICGSLVYIV